MPESLKHYDPNSKPDKIETINDVVKNWKRERLIEEVTDWMIPTFWVLVFIGILLLTGIFPKL